jgi:glycosyltransferase involved in cell wall biosynthesis
MPSSTPRVSIVTATRNRADLLLRTIDNVQMQSLQAWEMIVVDDGDGSGHTAALSLNEARVTAIHNPGTGQVDARNAGIKLARGAVIHLLDDDDRWADADHLEQVAEILSTEPALVYRAGWLVAEHEANGAWLETQRTSFDPPTTPESLRLDNTLLTSGVAYPRRFHAELGLLDPALGNYWDWDWFLRVTNQYPLVRLEPATVLMSWRGSNTSRDPFQPERLEYLRRLVEKHGLGEIAPKNHSTVLQS